MRDSLAYVIEMTNDLSPLEPMGDIHVVNDGEDLFSTDDATLLHPTAPNSDSVDSVKDENSNAAAATSTAVTTTATTAIATAVATTTTTATADTVPSELPDSLPATNSAKNCRLMMSRQPSPF